MSVNLAFTFRFRNPKQHAMNQQEATNEQTRIEKFNRLDGIRSSAQEVLNQLRADDPEGPHGQGPFTGNTRESRRVVALEIQFSQTLGGAPATNRVFTGLDVPAWELGKLLERLLHDRIAALDKAINDI